MESIVDALELFKRSEYGEKLKTQLTSNSIPPGHEDLLAFLYDQIIEFGKL